MRLVGRDRIVGVATRYGLVGPGIESRWGRGFPYYAVFSSLLLLPSF
jgi:hypothetical protein